MATRAILVYNPTATAVVGTAGTAAALAVTKITVDDGSGGAVQSDYDKFIGGGCVISDAVKSYTAFKRRIDSGYQFLMRYYDQENLV